MNNLQFVCKDDDGDWHYDADAQTYMRIKDGVLRCRITGQNLPDPDFLLYRRRQLFPDAAVEVISPTPATFALWDHWRGVSDS